MFLDPKRRVYGLGFRVSGLGLILSRGAGGGGGAGHLSEHARRWSWRLISCIARSTDRKP